MYDAARYGTFPKQRARRHCSVTRCSLRTLNRPANFPRGVWYDRKEGQIGVGNADCRLVKNRDLHIVCTSNVYTYICAHGRLASETRRMKERNISRLSACQTHPCNRGSRKLMRVSSVCVCVRPFNKVCIWRAVAVSTRLEDWKAICVQL
jgi:hypothetical protein